MNDNDEEMPDTQNTQNTQTTQNAADMCFSQEFGDSPMHPGPWGRLCPNKPKFLTIGKNGFTF